MAAAAQGLLKQIVFAEQSALGTPATTGGQILRRTSEGFSLARDSYGNNEILSHQQDTGNTASIRKTAGKLDGILSAGTYSKPIGHLLRKDFAATSAITGLSITIAGSGPTYTLTRASGDFLTGGIKVGDIVRLTAGSFNAANSNKNLLVVSVVALVLTVRVLNGVALVAEGPIASATLSVPGKKSWVPTTGHTNKYASVEKWFSDLSKSETYTDVKVASADITIPATGDATVSFDMPGLGRTLGSSATIVSPTAETTSERLSAVNAPIILVNGVVTVLTGASFKIDGQIQPGEAEIGSNNISDHVRGRLKVSGQIMSKFTDTALQVLFDAQTVITLIIPIADGSSAAAEFMCFVMSAVKIFGDADDDGESKEIVRSYPFTAQLNGSGGASLANLQTIISVQDSLAA